MSLALHESVSPELVRKVVAEQPWVEARPCGGKPRLMSRFPGFLGEFEHLVEGKPVDKAIVFQDRDGRAPAAAEEKMAQKVRDSLSHGEFTFVRSGRRWTRGSRRTFARSTPWPRSAASAIHPQGLR